MLVWLHAKASGEAFLDLMCCQPIAPAAGRLTLLVCFFHLAGNTVQPTTVVQYCWAILGKCGVIKQRTEQIRVSRNTVAPAMAPKKRPTAKDLGLTSPKRDGRKLTAKELSTMVKSMAPKARSPYALYLHEQHPIQRSRLQSEGLGGSGLQRAVVAAVSTAWREMPPEEKKIWEKKSAEERSRRQAALDEMQSSVELDKAPCSHQDSADTVIGCYIMEGAKAWVGSASWSVKAHHKKSLSAAQVIHFRDQDAFARELQVLREIEEQRDPIFCEEVYLQCYQATGVNSLPMALVCEDLPRVDQVLTQQGGLALPTFRSAAHQLGLALCQLHQLKIAHGDIKPAALFFSSEQNLLKLSRFSLSVPIPQ